MFTLDFPRPTYTTIRESEKTREKTRKKAREKTREKIIALILDDSKITTARMAKQTGLTKKGIEWQIAQLKKLGQLKRIGSDRSGHWKVIDK